MKNFNSKSYILIVTLFLLFIGHDSFALKAENLIEPSELPPQLCKIEFGLSLCSGIVVGKKAVLTASHCNNLNEKRGEITCLNGQNFKFERNQVRFFDAENVPSGLITVDTRENLKHDLILINLKEDFNLDPITVLNTTYDSDTILEALRTDHACKLYGVGLNSYGTIGLAHGISAPVYQGLSLTNPLELIGQTGVAPHDSGGAYICELMDNQGIKQNVLVGTIVGGKDNGIQVSSLISVFYDKNNMTWLEHLLTGN